MVRGVIRDSQIWRRSSRGRKGKGWKVGVEVEVEGYGESMLVFLSMNEVLSSMTKVR